MALQTAPLTLPSPPGPGDLRGEQPLGPLEADEGAGLVLLKGMGVPLRSVLGLFRALDTFKKQTLSSRVR